MKYLIANWKSTKNVNTAIEWVNEFNKLMKANKEILKKLDEDSLKIIICPSYHLISLVKQKIIKHKNINLGSQDVSFFEQGNYTGEVSAQNLKELINYSIVGHSERRKYLKETDNVIDQKVNAAITGTHGERSLDNKINTAIIINNITTNSRWK